MSPTPKKKKETYLSISQREGLSAGEQDLMLSQAAYEARRELAHSSPIAILPEGAEQDRIDSERLHRPVAIGEGELYLPIFPAEHVALPNALLRSPLWSATVVPLPANLSLLEQGEWPTFEASYDDLRIQVTGPKMGGFDRRVFAACIELFRDGPIRKEGKAVTVSLTFYKLVTMLRAGFSPETMRSVMASLRRLEATSIDAQVKKQEVHVPHLVKATWETEEQNTKSSDRVNITLPIELAQLFARNSWSAVPYDALDTGRGLQTWLSCFYSTHRAEYPIKLKRLHELSGIDCLPGDFRFKLDDALTKLKKLTGENKARVASFTRLKKAKDAAGTDGKAGELAGNGLEGGTDKEKPKAKITEVTVALARWNKTSGA